MLGFSFTACDQCVVFGMPKDGIPRLRPLIQLPEQLVFEITPTNDIRWWPQSIEDCA